MYNINFKVKYHDIETDLLEKINIKHQQNVNMMIMMNV